MGFDEQEQRPESPLVDAAPGDVEVADGVDAPSDGLAICMAPAPFLRFIDAAEGSTASLVVVTFCSSGLPGPVTASLRHASTAGVYVAKSGPIEDGMVELFVGGQGCTQCFARVEANGFVDDGPVKDFSGD